MAVHLNGCCQVKVRGSVICSQRWLFICLLFESCLELLLDVVALRFSFLLFFFNIHFIFPILYYDTHKVSSVHLFFLLYLYHHGLCYVCYNSLSVFNMVFQTKSGDMVLLKSPFLITLWLLSCKIQNILSDAPSIKLLQKELSYIFKILFDSVYCNVPDFCFQKGLFFPSQCLKPLSPSIF